MEKQLLLDNDIELTDLALSALQSIVRYLNESVDLLENTLLPKVFSSIVDGLMDTKLSSFDATVKIVYSCAGACPNACQWMVTKVFALLCPQLDLSKNLQIHENDKLLEVIQNFLKQAKYFNIIHKLDAFQLQKIELILMSIIVSEKNFKPQLILALKTLQCAPEIAKTENRNLIFTKLAELMANSSTSDDLSKLVCEVIVAFAEIYPKDVMKLIVEPEKNNLNSASTLLALAQLDFFLPPTSKVLFNFIFDTTFEEKKRCDVCKNIEGYFNSNDAKKILSYWYQEEFIKTLFEFNKQNLVQELDFCIAVSEIFAIIVKNLNPSEQQSIVVEYLPKLNLNSIANIYFAAGTLRYIDQSVLLDNHFENIIVDISKLAVSTTDQRIKETCDHLMCSLFNKMPNDAKRNKILDFILEEVKKLNKLAVITLSWISKALLVCGDPEASDTFATVIIKS